MKLSPRQSEVYEIIGQGSSYKAAASVLGISVRRVQEIACEVRDKLAIDHKPKTAILMHYHSRRG